MLKDLLLFLLMIAGGTYGLWVMRKVDGFIKRSREEKAGIVRKTYAYIDRIKEEQEKRAV
ncbi:MAG TPA: hypothetical protein H9756_01055 [Candidatus Mediterraneibacter gallistercoris]|uniref:Uncharacterized protein n=1 Tax=Candidatus Mediterraneibacter gallistercoris TaxID=2838671 RepID=A0A9D2P2T5_9FIRM|nr:hypothetical protein [Candidatus Mediterraneibacter gallistercoris]